MAKERGAIVEEWRGGRDARGRAAEAHWRLLFAGSRYESRLPIGREEVIKTTSRILESYRIPSPENLN